MAEEPLVCVARVHDGFHARVLAARLGSEGVLTQLRGAVDGPYPMGEVQVLVPEGEAETAREILLADEVEDALAGGADVEAPALGTREKVVLVAALAATALVAVARTIGPIT